MTAELVLCDANFTEGPFTNLVSNSIELMSGCNRLAHLLKVRYDHCDQVLLVLEQWVEHFCLLNFGRVLITVFSRVIYFKQK